MKPWHGAVGTRVKLSTVMSKKPPDRENLHLDLHPVGTRRSRFSVHLLRRALQATVGILVSEHSSHPSNALSIQAMVFAGSGFGLGFSWTQKSM